VPRVEDEGDFCEALEGPEPESPFFEPFGAGELPDPPGPGLPDPPEAEVPDPLELEDPSPPRAPEAFSDSALAFAL
jgi:hypothetical protein